MSVLCFGEPRMMMGPPPVGRWLGEGAGGAGGERRLQRGGAVLRALGDKRVCMASHEQRAGELRAWRVARYHF
jgi:hypothetical protein